MTLETYLIFLMTTAVVVFTPGAAAIAVASQGASNGGGRALAGAAGIASANAVYFLLSATGVASLLIASNLVFSIIKWVGVAYLAWLGLTAIFSPAGVIRVDASGRRKSLGALFAQGMIIEFANPKALLYFAAILPQFLDTAAPIAPQLLIMGATTLLLDLFSYGSYGFLGARLTRLSDRPWLISALNKTAGGALLYAGFRMASVTAGR